MNANNKPATGDTITTHLRLDSSDTATRRDTQFVSRLARRLVLTHTRRDDANIGFDGDTAARVASVAMARANVALTRRRHIAELDRLIDRVSLTILCWLQSNVAIRPASIDDLIRISPEQEANWTFRASRRDALRRITRVSQPGSVKIARRHG
ncbi:MAG TPA: hypothetical protein VFC19_30840 [Candidatus Limnocylindrales bacterium]|nr:hypothetical protein [Candidatus Limnocylindrales bacterium]